MPSKQEVLDSIVPANTYTGSQVRHLISSVKAEKIISPRKFKKGDIFGTHLGNKVRPAIIIKIVGGCAVAIPLTTKAESCHVLYPVSSRFSTRESYYSNTITVVSLEHVEDNYMGVLDNPKNLNKAIAKLKEFYKEIL